MRKTLIGVAAAAALVFAADSATFAQDKKPKKAPKQTQDRGVDDAAAEELVPAERNVAGVKVTRHPGGMMSAQLDESFEEAIVVTRNADGTLTQTCIHGLPLASAHVRTGKPLTSATPVAPKPEVK